VIRGNEVATGRRGAGDPQLNAQQAEHLATPARTDRHTGLAIDEPVEKLDLRYAKREVDC
jgi:hypothetical protein